MKTVKAKMQKGGTNRETIKGSKSNLVKETTNYGNGQKTVSIQRTTPQGTVITGKSNPLSSNNKMSTDKSDMSKMNKGFAKQKSVNDKAAQIARSTYKMTKMKTGGMVNSNAKVSALKTAGSKGVKSGVNSKVSASKVAKGRVGGTSTAPKTATPKAKMGGMMKGKKC